MNPTLVLSLAMMMAINFSVRAAETAVEKSRTGQGVTAFNKEDGFKLSDGVLKRLEIKFVKIQGESAWKVPQTAIVKLKHSIGVYRRFEGWITLVLVRVEKSEGDLSLIRSSDLQAQDEIAVSGTTFLRMTEADLNSDTVDTCSH